MFFYLSFLRPPPRTATPGSALIITPQVANDLRTEPFESSQDIFYSWSPCTPSPSSTTNVSRGVLPIAKPQKLTTWRQETAYREIKVPPPTRVVNGQSYRLVLTTHDQGLPHIINLGSPACGPRPLPVMSMPILFITQHAQGVAPEKQERVERIYRIPLSSSENAFMKIKEQTSFDLDKKVWDSGIGLSSWLCSLYSEPESNGAASSGLKEALFSKESRKVIELGTGTGIVSLTLGILRSALGHQVNDGCIIATDLTSAMPLLEQNVSENGELFKGPSTRPQPIVLDWEVDDLPPEVTVVSEGFDVILMADVTYNTSSFPALLKTMRKLLALGDCDSEGQRRDPWIVLGYKERSPDERTLWDLALEIGVKFEKLDERIGAGGLPVEIWISRPKQHE